MLALFPFLLLAGAAGAGPPRGPSGRMAFDAVADGLRHYRHEKDPETRATWLKRLAPSGDPRVAAALGEALVDESPLVAAVAADEALHHYAHEPPAGGVRTVRYQALMWWVDHRDEVLRRARMMPK